MPRLKESQQTMEQMVNGANLGGGMSRRRFLAVAGTAGAAMAVTTALGGEVIGGAVRKMMEDYEDSKVPRGYFPVPVNGVSINGQKVLPGYNQKTGELITTGNQAFSGESTQYDSGNPDTQSKTCEPPLEPQDK
jgi:hypothetical protein